MSEPEPIPLETLAQDVFTRPGLVEALLRGPRPNAPDKLEKVDVRPVVVRGETRFQFALQRGPQALHENLAAEDATSRLVALLTTAFRQGVIRTTEADWEISLNKRREPLIRKRPPTRTAPAPSVHDRRKNHVLPDNAPLPFLVRLGLTTPDSTPIAARRDKLRQINRFLELVADVLDPDPQALTSEPFRVVDFGCGKGYLTFALYHYLTVVRGINAQIIGVDVKAEVIADINAIARELGYDGLTFQVGGIADFAEWEQADMVIALHACDTATDDALLKALALNAHSILAAPCCQHELFRQLDSELMRPLLKHGILRERLSALITDAARAELLQMQGYVVSILEFVDAEHTPKNLLIRAARREGKTGDGRQKTGDGRQKTGDKAGDEAIQHPKSKIQNPEWERFRDFWHIAPALERGLKSHNADQPEEELPLDAPNCVP